MTLATGAAHAAAPVRHCEAPAYHVLDFWLGRWLAYADGRRDGTDDVAKTLGGCAIEERWREPNFEGRGLFYVDPTDHEWRQIWLTPAADQPGGAKVRRFDGRTARGGIRFLGTYPGRHGTITDRATITPLPSGDISYVIELSRDGGTHWRRVYDARFVHPAVKGAGAP